MNVLENRIKGLEQHIEKLYNTIEGWEKLAREKDDIIKKYEAQVKNNVGLANVSQRSELFGERYPMTSDQPAQIDCRMTDCRFHKNGSCKNVAPALTFDDNKITCWTRISEPNCG